VVAGAEGWMGAQEIVGVERMVGLVAPGFGVA
jgi:hypothetical protein